MEIRGPKEHPAPDDPDTLPVRVLLIEDNPADVRLIREALSESRTATFALTHAGCLSSGLAELERSGADVVLLDLHLPDSQGLETFVAARARAPDAPIVVLTGLDDEEVGVGAVNAGAQDYLVKGRVSADLLVRSLRFAIERNRVAELRRLTLVDELTGLYNRRGFVTLAELQLKLAHRTKQPLALLFIDMNELKAINDTWGHHSGDLALADTARVLQETFRRSDIIARVAGDEFCVLLIGGSDEDAEAVMVRLDRVLDDFNRAGHRPFAITLSVGAASLNPGEGGSIDELMQHADRHMYERKARRTWPVPQVGD